MFLKSHAGAAAVFIILALLLPEQALAYAGPGAGISALGTLFAIMSAFFLAIVGFIWYPIKRLIRWLKGKSREDPAAEK